MTLEEAIFWCEVMGAVIVAKSRHNKLWSVSVTTNLRSSSFASPFKHRVQVHVEEPYIHIQSSTLEEAIEAARDSWLAILGPVDGLAALRAVVGET